MNKCLLFNVGTPRWAGRPAGPYRIAHILREQGWDCEVFEFTQLWTMDELKALAYSRIDSNTKFLGFGHLFSIFPKEMEEWCMWIKQQWPHIHFISGSSVLPDFDTKVFDYYIQGFSEVAIVELLKYMYSNGSRPRFDIQWQSKGIKLIKANDQYPAYPMQSLMIKYEDRDFIDHREWLTIEFSRGCKFHCAFCNYPILGVKGDYSRDGDDARMQLQDAYDRFGVTNYMVSDETFNDRTEKITKFADAVEKLNFTPWFSGYIRFDLLTSRPLDRHELLRMNFLGHFYGIESFNTESARAIGKGMDSERIKQSLLEVKHFFKSNGRKLYRGNLGLIVGLPHETKQSIENTYNWLIENWNDQSFDVWALELPKGDAHRDNKIGSNMAKYGYREIPIDIDIIKPMLEDLDDVHPLLLEMGGNKLWENDHMNVFDAKKLAYRFLRLIDEKKFGIGPFAMSSVYTHMLTLEEILSTPLVELSSRIDHNFISPDRSLPQCDIINNYIHKKLTI
jgi:hypothetical protein